MRNGIQQPKFPDPCGFKYVLIFVILGWGGLPGLARAQLLPDLTLELRFSSLQSPVVITHAGDGSGRQFIAEQPGRVKVVQSGTLLTAPFLDIAAKVLLAGERGLLGLAFPPNFSGKQYFYVFYTGLTGDNVVARYAVSADPNRADPNSEQIILTLPHQLFGNHNGGQLAFSPLDGFLYIGTGDGGGSGDPLNNAQNPQSLHGKILRIDVESTPAPGAAYAIPPTNPFSGMAGYRPEIWALGLRNPWRFSFDRLTGDLYIGDVGQNNFEEVDFQPAGSAGGENYGWNILEGPACFNPPNCGLPPGNVPPVMFYDHSEGVAILGGYVYRGSRSAFMAGSYFFGDLNGKIWSLRQVAGIWQRQLLSLTRFLITTFGEDEAGNLYVADYLTGRVYEMLVTSTARSYVLWTKGGTGQAIRWKVDPVTAASTGWGWISPQPGVGAGWQASSYARRDATMDYVLWTNDSSGQAVRWHVDPVTGVTTGGVWISPTTGVGAGWQASSYARGDATTDYVLWTNSGTGQAIRWQVDPVTGALTGWGWISPTTGVGAGWQASSYARGDATTDYVLWTNGGTGQAIRWQIDPLTGARTGWRWVSPTTGVGAGWQASSYLASESSGSPPAAVAPKPISLPAQPRSSSEPYVTVPRSGVSGLAESKE